MVLVLIAEPVTGEVEYCGFRSDGEVTTFASHARAGRRVAVSGRQINTETETNQVNNSCRVGLGDRGSEPGLESRNIRSDLAHVLPVF